MGLICPCGTGSDREERETPKTTSIGVSTQQPKEHGKHHRQKVGSPSKKPLVVSGESTDSFRKSGHQTRSDRQLGVKGTSSHTKQFKKDVPTKEKGSQKNVSQRRSRSLSSHRERAGQNLTKSDRHLHRGHSTEARTEEKNTGEKKTVLNSKNEHRHKHYGGTDMKEMSAVKTSKKSTRSDVTKDNSRSRQTEVAVVKPYTKVSQSHQTSKPEKEKKAKDGMLPSSEKEKYLKEEDKKRPRRPRSTAPSYVIPMAAMLK